MVINGFFALAISLSALLQPKPYDISVDAKKMYYDYKNDKSKADKLYLDKRIYLQGIVKEESANMSVVYLVIPAPGDGITAVIDDSALTKIPIYKPGDKFGLVCIGAGIVFELPLVLHCTPLN